MKASSIWKGVLLLALLNFSVYAQEEGKSYGAKCNQFALQFGISHNFTLMSFQGSNFSGKYHFTKQSAIRLGVSIVSRFDDATLRWEMKDENEMDIDIEGQNNQLSLGLNLQYLHYSEIKKNLFIYIGGGTSFGKIKYQSFRIDENDTIDFKSERYDKSWSIGLSVVLGIEYFINNDFSISAEYGTNLRYFDSESSSDYYDGKRETSKTGFNITAKRVLFGLTVYL